MPDFFTGSQQIVIEDRALNISFPVLIHYPTVSPSMPTAVGPYTMDIADNAAIATGVFPLVILSHGNGGSNLIYSTISTYLAKHGFIVVLPEHYGNNRNNNSLENTEKNLILRPGHISLCIDHFLSDPFFEKNIDTSNISVIGHSMGGYSALALAGGTPRTKEGKSIPTIPDPRVKALVLLAPGAGWFKFGLEKVTIPILLMSAELDIITPAWNAAIILEGVPDQQKVIHRVIKNAGHFSFLSPFPELMKKPGFFPATDPLGFDRVAFHDSLPNEILDFLKKSIG